MKIKILLLIIYLLPQMVFAQRTTENNLPNGFSNEELEMMKWYDFHQATEKFGLDTAPTSPVRTMAEWEEIQSLCVTWTQYKSTVADIIRHAKEEVEVIVICSNAAVAQSQLLNTYNLPDLNNVTFLEKEYDSIWMRDYGPNTIYLNDVDSLSIVEWIYNRPRPDDDLLPDAIGEAKGIPVYSTITAPLDLVNTGGNFTADGMGTGFASNLILDENDINNPYNVTPKTEEEIDTIMQEWMGIDRYIKMETLPYDEIHHIDMHMKLLDEETILMGEYPTGVADGPQIEENLEYVLNNFLTPFGNPYEVIRIQMPPDNGSYPNTNGDYRTYTNSVFVNGTVLVPIYEEEFDTTALRIYEENLPGYNVVGIDCNAIINSLGALHCITRAIGVEDPLLINHSEHADITNPIDDFEINAFIKHKTGIANAQLHWTIDLNADYEILEMSLTDEENEEWTAFIPNTGSDVTIHYYIAAEANNGKNQVRPLVAPEGYFNFDVEFSVDTNEAEVVNIQGLNIIAPNPSSGNTIIQITTEGTDNAELKIVDVLGREVEILESTTLTEATYYYEIDVSDFEIGVYFVRFENGGFVEVKKLIVR